MDGSLECLKYLRYIKSRWDKNTCIKAAEYDQLECLKYAHENRCPMIKKHVHQQLEMDIQNV